MLHVSCPARFLTRWFPALLLLAAVALATVPGAASAAVQWHADLDAARTAARVSGKPVFVLFAADWDDHAAAAVLSTAEVDAVITACFEPVRIDVDTQPELTRTLGVDRVPSVAVLDAKDGVVTKFECPATPAEFVAATARAAQVAAAATVLSSPTEFAAGREVSPFGDPLDHALEPVASNVTEKVRQLSSFADGKPMPLRDPERFPAIVREPDNHGQLDATPTALASAADTPALDRTPPAWPAERPPASAFSQPAIATASAATPATTASDIEPAPVATGPWLSGTTTAPAEQAAPEAAATASEVTADPAPESSSFMATLTKPFTSLFRWPSKPAVEPPPKMPAALPQSPAQVAASERCQLSRPRRRLRHRSPIPMARCRSASRATARSASWSGEPGSKAEPSGAFATGAAPTSSPDRSSKRPFSRPLIDSLRRFPETIPCWPSSRARASRAAAPSA